MGMQQNSVHTTKEVKSEISSIEHNPQLGKEGTSPILNGGSGASYPTELGHSAKRGGGKMPGITNNRDNPHGTNVTKG